MRFYKLRWKEGRKVGSEVKGPEDKEAEGSYVARSRAER